MESINSYLTILVQQNGNEIRLEPNQPVQLFTYGGKQDLTPDPVTGAEISTAIFPVIPAIERQKLPSQPDVSFDYDLSGVGKFSFLVRKSPSGFIVSVKPSQNKVSESQFGSLTIPNMTPNFASMLTDDKTSGQKDSENTSWFEQTSQPVGQPENDFFSQPKSFEPTNETQTPEDPVTSKSPFSIDFDFETGSSTPQPTQSTQQEQQPQEIFSMQTDSTQEAFTKLYESNKEVLQMSAQVNDAAVQEMEKLFKQMADMGASDLHLCVGMPPLVRKDGKIMVLDTSREAFTQDEIAPLLTSIMPHKNREEFTERNDTDFAYEIIGTGRYRSNIFADRKGMGAVFRLIPHKILTVEQLGLSQAILKLCQLTKGLVVVTGPTGCGKSTTLCAMIDYINRTRDDHIITIEDPIEFVHENKRCLINQREVFTHTASFHDALRAAFREDPDIILVGEMRDLETISTAIETAETGHLVFGTLHTTTAASTVDRIIDQFPTDRQSQIRVMLSESLRAVIAQTLLRKKGGGRVAALEVLIITPAISNLIREGKTFQIVSAIQTGKALGMVGLNDALLELVKNGTVEADEAYSKAVDKITFESMLSRNSIPLSVKT